MLRLELGKLDLLGNGIATGDGGLAGAELGIVDTLALGVLGGLVAVAGEPVLVLAAILLAVLADGAVLAVDVGALQEALLEAVLGLLLLRLGGRVVRLQELVDDLLVLADTVAEHAAVVAVVVETPHHFDLLARLVCLHGLSAPVCRRLVVVKTVALVEPAGSHTADLGAV